MKSAHLELIHIIRHSPFENNLLGFFSYFIMQAESTIMHNA
jgi:hypothetical protein